MNIFEEIPTFDLFDTPEPDYEVVTCSDVNETPVAKNPIKKINLNNVNLPIRDLYLKKLREKIEKKKRK